MEEDTPYRRSLFFTIRLWPENMGWGQIDWRGKVQYIPGGDTLYFRDWLALLAFLEKVMSKDEDNFDHGTDHKGYSSSRDASGRNNADS